MHVALVTARVRYLDAPSELKVPASVAAGLFGHGTTYARVDMTESPQGPVFMEAELIEPQLFFAARPEAARSASQQRWPRQKVLIWTFTRSS